VTFYQLVRLSKIVNSPRLALSAVLLADILGIKYQVVNFDPILACNLRCKMCDFSNPLYRQSMGGKMSEEDIQRLAKVFFPLARRVQIGCGAEPTTYQKFPLIVELAKKYHVPHVTLVTNSQLLTEDHLIQLVRLGLDELIISVHGVRKETYEYFMGNAKFDRLTALLDQLSLIKAEHQSQLPRLRINYAVNNDNLEELADFFDVFGKYCIDVLQIRPINKKDYQAYISDLHEVGDKYTRITNQLRRQALDQNIVCLITNLENISSSSNKTTKLIESVLRYISPRVVWKPDFAWRDEDYRDYCKRTKWRWAVLRAVIRPVEASSYHSAARYDVDL